MDNIRDITTQIRKAAYGRDVRENIALGIEKISDREDSFEQLINASEVTRQNNESTRQANEVIRVDNENTRKTNETSRVNDENTRKLSEDTRVTNENQRKTNETTRQDNESIRLTKETERQNNESTRQSNENTRVTEETLRETNESIRSGNELLRETNESSRVTNENIRAINETVRTDNENLRETHETTRVNQESARQNNESIRQSQETTRQSNETLRQETIDALKVNEVYNPNHDYKILNKVMYDGSSYMNISPCKGVLPTNTTNWICIATKGLDGTGAGDMVKSRYDTDDDGIVDRAEVADSVEWIGVKNSPTFAEKTYVDDQLQTITATGVPKLVSYTYEYIATEGQTKFVIPYEYFNHINDKVEVKLDGYDVPTSYYTITNPVENPDGTIIKGYVTTNVGRPKDSFVKIIISKNVPLGTEGAIPGNVLAVDSVPQNRVQGLVELQNDVKKANGTVIPEVAYGMNSKITNATKTSVSPKFTIKGKTVINLLGRDGNCEDISKYFAYQSTITLDNVNKVFGNNSIKITSTNTNGGAFAKTISTTNNGGAYVCMDITKYYLVSAYVKNGNAATGMSIRKDNSGGGSSVASPDITDTSKFNRVGIVLQPSQMKNGDNLGVYCIGASGQYGWGDGIQINEITPSEYTLGVDALLVKYPYADSYACLQNPYIEVRHDNLVRNGNGEEGIAWWTPSNGNPVLSIVNGKFQLLTTDFQYYYQLINVKPNTNYYLSFNQGGANASVRVTDGTLGVTIKDGIGSFNTGENTLIAISIRGVVASTSTFDSIILVEGITPPTEYKSCRIERCVIEGKFTSDDSLIYQNGNITGLINWKHKTLFGKDYNWQYDIDGSGFKTIRIPNIFYGQNFPQYYQGLTCVKYDGKVLPTLKSGSWSGGDIAYSDGISNYNGMFVSIADVNTGWTETINPNNDEVKAFMNGWKAINIYGTRYNLFISVVDGSIPSGATSSNITTGGTTTFIVPDGSIYAVNDAIYFFRNGVYFGGAIIASISGNTITINATVNTQANDTCVKGDVPPTNTSLLTWCKNNIAPGYEGYQLHYKLQNPEPITDINTHIHGDIPKFNVGDNYLYLDSGVVLGEVVNPKNTDNSTYYLINNISSPVNGLSNDTRMKNQTEVIMGIFKNQIYDQWVITSGLSYGKTRAYIPVANFDTSATYRVDYKILSTIAPQIGSIGCSYSQDIVSAINGLSEEIGSKQNRDSTLDVLVDLGMYEVIDRSGGWSIPQGWFTRYGSLQFSITIPYNTPKVTIPHITINNLAITCYDASTDGVNATNKFIIGHVSISKSHCQILMVLQDSSILSNIKNYGLSVMYKITADCRGRI